MWVGWKLEVRLQSPTEESRDGGPRTVDPGKNEPHRTKGTSVGRPDVYVSVIYVTGVPVRVFHFELKKRGRYHTHTVLYVRAEESVLLVRDPKCGFEEERENRRSEYPG